MQKIYQLWAVFKAKNGHEWTELTFRTSLWSSIHHVRAVAYRFSAVFPRSTISGKAGREFWRNLDVKLCLERYFYTCTLDLYPKISALEVDMGQIIWFIDGFAPVFQTFWAPFGSMCRPFTKVQSRTLTGPYFLLHKSPNFLGPSQKIDPEPGSSLGPSQNFKPDP